MKSSFNRTGGRLLAGAATIALSTVAMSTPAHAIVPNDNIDPNGVYDPDYDPDSAENPQGAIDANDVYSGVGMFFRNDGSVCSGTLINPRTVLFAAHCVNNRAATDFNEGSIRSAWSFNVFALTGCPLARRRWRTKQKWTRR